MYAIIETGGKQHKVAVGDKLKVEKLAIAQGASMELERVLMVADGEQVAVGASLAGTEHTVSATVLGHGRGDKIRVFKMKRRKNYRRTQGHRQAYTEIEITAIGGEQPAVKKVTSKTAASAKVTSKTATNAKVADKTTASAKVADKTATGAKVTNAKVTDKTATSAKATSKTTTGAKVTSKTATSAKATSKTTAGAKVTSKTAVSAKETS